MIRTNGWLTVLLSAASEEHFDKESAVQAEPTEVFIWVHGKPSLKRTRDTACPAVEAGRGDRFGPPFSRAPRSLEECCT